MQHHRVTLTAALIAKEKTFLTRWREFYLSCKVVVVPMRLLYSDKKVLKKPWRKDYQKFTVEACQRDTNGKTTWFSNNDGENQLWAAQGWWPAMQIAMAGGPYHVGVDVDGADVVPMVHSGGFFPGSGDLFKKTCYVDTPSGGRHYYFSMSPYEANEWCNWPKSQNFPLPGPHRGVEVKSAGTFLIAPPSYNPFLDPAAAQGDWETALMHRATGYQWQEPGASAGPSVEREPRLPTALVVIFQSFWDSFDRKAAEMKKQPRKRQLEDDASEGGPAVRRRTSSPLQALLQQDEAALREFLAEVIDPASYIPRQAWMWVGTCVKALNLDWFDAFADESAKHAGYDSHADCRTQWDSWRDQKHGSFGGLIKFHAVQKELRDFMTRHGCNDPSMDEYVEPDTVAARQVARNIDLHTWTPETVNDAIYELGGIANKNSDVDACSANGVANYFLRATALAGRPVKLLPVRSAGGKDSHEAYQFCPEIGGRWEHVHAEKLPGKLRTYMIERVNVLFGLRAAWLQKHGEAPAGVAPRRAADVAMESGDDAASVASVEDPDDDEPAVESVDEPIDPTLDPAPPIEYLPAWEDHSSVAERACEDAADRKKRMDPVYKRLRALRQTINNAGGKLAICKELATLPNSSFPKDHVFDHSRYLTGCNNGVLDTVEGRLRPGRPEDYVTRSVGFAYPTGDDPELTAEIAKFLEMAFPDPVIREHMLNVNSRYCTSFPTKRWYIHYGTGDNLKSALHALLRATFGDYSKQISAKYVTSDETNSSQATPELARPTPGRLGGQRRGAGQRAEDA